jgi:hypothetical protein
MHGPDKCVLMCVFMHNMFFFFQSLMAFEKTVSRDLYRW